MLQDSSQAHTRNLGCDLKTLLTQPSFKRRKGGLLPHLERNSSTNATGPSRLWFAHEYESLLKISELLSAYDVSVRILPAYMHVGTKPIARMNLTKRQMLWRAQRMLDLQG